ncbi:hypothetical protein F4780DRAFT_790162 [Xylariomycetidae sp. FL0641]|nr:hypothetical protein F4780DRAFT_790162 [Xylariomycetidae sp. FL0641]
MAPVSSPLVYPASSSPPPPVKRSKPHPEPSSRPRAKAGFLVDDDSDDDATFPEPAPKRRMLSSPTAEPVPESTEPSSPPQDVTKVPEPADDAVPTTLMEEKTTEIQNQGSVLQSLLAAGDTSSVFSRFASRQENNALKITTCAGNTTHIKRRRPQNEVSYERMVAARSKTKKGRAERSYYGIDIHELVETASKELANEASSASSATATAAVVMPDEPMPSVEAPARHGKKPRKALLWTEKYRARNFVDLVGDDLTNRQVLRWLKRWDALVFPGAAKSRPVVRRAKPAEEQQQQQEEKPHRKVLLLTGPPGLGKTTLAHVCARQAGYEVLEINASDDRGRDVVKGRIRTSLGTENVKTVQQASASSSSKPSGKVARPVCVVVDEVDGVTTGSGGSGEGGFVRALMDLITTGEKNASAAGSHPEASHGRRKKKADDFRQMRPLVLICNDVYHPSLRPLRQSGLAEIIHVGKPTVDAVVSRLKSVFEKEGIPCEKDAARKLCEAAWGMSSGMDAKRGAESTAEGDLRGIMVVGEWVAGRLRAASLRGGPPSLSRQWVEQHILRDLAHGGGGARGVGRGNVKDIVTRVFQDGAGFPKPGNVLLAAPPAKHAGEQPVAAPLGFSEQQKKHGMERLREMVETSGDADRVVADVFAAYPAHDFNDDSFLSKPDAAYEWLHFHDCCASRLFGSQDWELAPYLAQPVLACHDLFATPIRHASRAAYENPRRWGDAEDDQGQAAKPLPFSGPRADAAAREQEREHRALLQALQAQLPPTLSRAFRSPEHVAQEFLPYLVRLVAPDVKPVVVGGSGSATSTASVRRESEKAMVARAAAVLADVGVELQKGRIEQAEGAFSRAPQWVYRMEPDLDLLATFESSAAVQFGTQAPPTRYAVRQVLDQELQKTRRLREAAARQARSGGALPPPPPAGLALPPALDARNKGKADAAAAAAALPAIPVKKDFFGRVVLRETDGNAAAAATTKSGAKAAADEPLGTAETKVWVTFHEGMNNAVRKPITLEDLLRGM